MSATDTTSGAVAVNQPARGNQTRYIDRILSLPRARVYRNAGLVIATGTDTLITWDVLDYDTDGMWDAANPTRLYCRTAGLFGVNGWCQWPAVGAGGVLRQMRLRVNGGAKFDSPITYTRDPGDASPVTNTVSISFPLVAGDYLEMLVNQNNGAGLAFNGATLGSQVNGLQATCLSLP